MKHIFLALAFLVFTNSFINAQVSITTGAGLTYSQDFNTLDPAATAPGSTNLPTGWSIFETGTAANQMYVSGDGASNGGNVYSYGTTAATERALGSLSSGSVRSAYGVKFTNNTGATITGATVTYKGEQWRSGDAGTTNPDTLYFGYSYVATSIDTSATGWIDEPALNFLAPQPTATTGAMDGNLSGNNSTVTFNLTGISVSNGTGFSLRWLDKNMGGSDDGLAVDDFTVTFTTSSGPTAPVLVSSSPADNSVGVATTVNTLVMNFNQNVTAGTGYIYLYDLTTPDVDSFSIASCTFAGSSVTVNGISLATNISYAVQVPATAVQTAGLYYAGISNNTSWNFNTNVVYTPFKDTLFPADNSTNVAITAVPYIVFDKNIAAGTGTVKIVDLTAGGAPQTLTVPSADVVISGKKATFNNVVLANGKNYAILYDSGCFVNAAVTTSKCLGSYDSTFWNFSTVAGIQPPITSLNETFTGCLSPNFGVFTENSVVGSQTWRCSVFGNGDSNAVYVNGFSGSALDNEDWLISRALDLNAMSNPYLHFYSKQRFPAATTKEVLVSSNYTGTGDPNLATWTGIPVNFSNLNTTYQAYNNNNLTAYKATPFYLAFKYISTTTDADEWSLDDIKVTDGSVSIGNIQNFDGKFYVLGTPNTALNLLIDAKEYGEYNFIVNDITGRNVISAKQILNSGKNNLSMDISNLSQGVYTVKLQFGKQEVITKFVK